MPAVSSPTQISFDRILVLSDFLPSSRLAVLAAAALVRVRPAELMVMHVGAGGAADRAAVDEALRGVPHEILMNEGDFWTSVDGMAARRGVDLIVVNTHRRGDFMHLLAGSTAEQLLRRVKAPVLTIGPSVMDEIGPPRAGQPVLYATDFSENSLHALPHAVSFAERQQGTLLLSHVLSYDTTLTIRPIDADEHSLERVRGVLYRLLPAEPERTIPIEVFARFGFAAETIVETARSRNASAIILGIRGSAPGILSHLPTTLHEIIQDAHCPVLTVAA